MACPICGGSEFREHFGRPAAVCTTCDGLERHRALVEVCGDVMCGAPGACLEVAPANRMVFGGFLKQRGWDYTSIDKWRTGNPQDPREAGFVDLEADLADLSPFDDDRFDLVLVQHVIEEIPAYRAALAEVNRVLREGGVALLEIPYDGRLERSVSQTPGQYGNVWQFGRDLLDDVRRTFASVETRPLALGAYSSEVMLCSTSLDRWARR